MHFVRFMTSSTSCTVESLRARKAASRHRFRQRTRATVLVLAVSSFGGLAYCRDAPTVDAPQLSIGFVDDGSTQAERALAGITLGIDEAASAGRLLGRTVELETADYDSNGAVVAAATSLIDQGVFALVGGFDEAHCEELSRLAEARDVLFVNIGCRADALRDSAHRHVFHIEASDSSYFTALQAHGGGGRAPVLWHDALARYGATQLNQRFLRHTGAHADATMWAGWMAVKVLWQVARDANSIDADVLIRHLESDSAAFDGHKGEALAFDPSSHQLMQPLYPPPTGVKGVAVSNTPMRVFPTEESAALEAAWKRRASLVLVTNEESRDVSVIDLAKREVLATIPVQYRPRGVQVSPDGRWAYVATSDDAPTHASDADAIVAIDLRDGTIVSRHAAGSDPEQFAVTPDGVLLVASNEDAGTATITDLVSGRVLETLTVGIEPEGVAVSPDGRWIYVTAETSNTVSVIDVSRREVVSNFLVDERPRAAVFSPDSKRAYVTNEISGTVSVVDVGTHRVVGVVKIGDARAKPVGVAVSPDGRRVYVANGHAGSVSVIDAQSLREVGSVATGKRPWGVALDRSGRLLISANGVSNTASIIDTRTLEVIATIDVGARPWGAVVNR